MGSDLVACLNSQKAKLYHIGIRSKVSRSTLADANERCDWRLFEALGHRLIAITLELYQDKDIGLGLKEPLYAMDSTTIDMCLTLFPRADFRSTKAAVKAHTVTYDPDKAQPGMLTKATTNAGYPSTVQKSQ